GRAGPVRRGRRRDHRRDAQRALRYQDRNAAHLRRAAGGGRAARGAPPSRPPPRLSHRHHSPSPRATTPMTPSLSPNPIADLRQLFTYPFMVNALEAGTIVAVLAGIVGWYVVLRRQTFASHTLSVMAFPGAAGAALAGLPTALGYYVACTAAALAIGRTGRGGRPGRAQGGESAVIGTVQSVGLAAGFLFLSLTRPC